jgi:mono/diheme cytochrome c family protein
MLADGATNAPAVPAPVLAGRLPAGVDIVFCTRDRYDDGHWYANLGYYCDDAGRKAYAGNGKPDRGRLCRLDPRTGAVTVLHDARGGSVRDPQVHYDGHTILFALRPAGTDFYHLHEIQADGTGLRRLTDGPFDDIEPTYLPDGDIVFVSTRARRWVNCWMTQVATLHRCRADGADIRRISANTEHDNTPWPLPDGRLLYTRWEYVDRSQVEYHALWTMNPDGTDQNVYYGNQHSWIVMIDAKPVPGSTEIVASFSPGHGRNEHAGTVTVVRPERGPDAKEGARALHKGSDHRDPYPLADGLVLAAIGPRLVLLDRAGRQETLYTDPDGVPLHEPRPLAARPRERVIPPRVDPHQATGRFLLSDVYRGRNLDGVRPGDIRKLLVLESLPKPVNFSGGMDLTSWSGSFTLERVLGTVPVEADGSAYFEAPANRQLLFVALDGQDLSVKRMQSWTSVMPGETMGCIGCHEHRTEAPAAARSVPLAARRVPSRIAPIAGAPDVPDYHRDVQPILDRHCVACHGPQRYEGGVMLTGDLGPHWAIGYFSLLAHRLVADGRNGLGNQPPRTIGSSASPLLRYAAGGHHGTKVSDAERRTLWLWIEAGAPYAGSYAGLRNAAQQDLAGRANGTALGGMMPVLQRRCAECHDVGKDSPQQRRPLPLDTGVAHERAKQALNRPAGQHERLVLTNDPIARYSAHVLVNLSRPDCSPLALAPLAKSAGGWERCGAVFANRDDADWQAIVAALERGRAQYGDAPRWGQPGFRPNAQYVRELQRFAVLPATFDVTRDPLDVFAADQRYWALFEHRP